MKLSSIELTKKICFAIESDAGEAHKIDPRTSVSLAELYFSLEDDFRFYIMNYVSQVKNKTARSLLKRILLEDRSVLVRHEAAFALGVIGNAQDKKYLRQVLLNDKNSLVRHEAAMALGVVGTKRDLPTLKLGLRDRNKMVAQSCFAAITLVKMRGAAPS